MSLSSAATIELGSAPSLSSVLVSTKLVPRFLIIAEAKGLVHFGWRSPLSGVRVVVSARGHMVSIKERLPSLMAALTCNPTSNLQDGVEYRAGDITDAATLYTLLEEIKPQVIIHAASPRSSAATLNYKEQVNTNINGTKNLLARAVKISSVWALVFTCTVSVASGSLHVNVDETQPTCQLNSKHGTVCYQAKAAAERPVLEANSESLKTVSLRLYLVYGERDFQFVPGLLRAEHNKQTGVQLGNNENLIDTVYAGNAASAHVLAAKALLNPCYAPGKVDGEAFNITDSNPVPFWDLSRLVWCAAGDKWDV